MTLLELLLLSVDGEIFKVICYVHVVSPLASQEVIDSILLIGILWRIFDGDSHGTCKFFLNDVI